MTYCNSCGNKYGDEVMVVQNDRTVFKGCLTNGGNYQWSHWNLTRILNLLIKDQFTFKSKRYQDDPKLKLEFYINDVIEEQIILCCEHALIKKCNSDCFLIENISGSKPCQK